MLRFSVVLLSLLFNAALFCCPFISSSYYFFPSDGWGDRYIYWMCLCMSHAQNKRALLLNYQFKSGNSGIEKAIYHRLL
jgi:hypothetical protein